MSGVSYKPLQLAGQPVPAVHAVGQLLLQYMPDLRSTGMQALVARFIHSPPM